VARGKSLEVLMKGYVVFVKTADVGSFGSRVLVLARLCMFCSLEKKGGVGCG
jgi:hypothetical protein